MGFIEDTRDFTKSAAARLDKVERALADLLRNRAVDPQAAASASIAGSPWLALASQEDLAYVVITGGPLGDGYFTARRQAATPARQMLDDDELTEEIKVYPVGGATPFKGAAGIARYSGRIGTPEEPLWLTVCGEWNGFPAKLMDAPDASESYAWQQVGTAPFTAPLTNTTGGATPLGRALDYSWRSHEVGVTLPRSNFQANTVVVLRWDPIDSRMFFYGRREPQTTDQCAS